MNGELNPPNDITPSALLKKLIERPRPSELVDYPAKLLDDTPIQQVRIIVLSGEQNEEARFRGRRYLKTKKQMTDQDIDSAWGVILLGDAVAREVIAMSVCEAEAIDPESTTPTYPLIFPTSAHVNQLPADEIAALFGAVTAVQRKYGPFSQRMDELEVNAWIQRLQEGASALPLSLLASHQRDELCLRLSARAALLSNLLISLRENLPPSLDSIPGTWILDTTLSTEPASHSTPSGEDRIISVDEALTIAKELGKFGGDVAR